MKVADVRANPSENVVHAAEVIGGSKLRRAVFEAIYFGKKKVKTVDELAQTTGLDAKQVLTAGRKLAANQIVNQTKVSGRTAYEKDEFFAHRKAKVLALVDDPAKVATVATKQRPHGHQKVSVQIWMARSQPIPQLITIDDVESFAAAKNATPAKGISLSALPEVRIKRFLQHVIGETGVFTDWGGEKNDLYTTRLRYRGKRVAAAFALKGKATKAPLTPKKMGKNGDQLGRLFTSEAQFFFVVFHSKIDEAVVQQTHAYALARALTGNRIYYGMIDGDDLGRLVAAYPAEFKASAKP